VTRRFAWAAWGLSGGLALAVGCALAQVPAAPTQTELEKAAAICARHQTSGPQVELFTDSTKPSPLQPHVWSAPAAMAAAAIATPVRIFQPGWGKCSGVADAVDAARAADKATKETSDQSFVNGVAGALPK
jgi:hypothetical protein